MTSAPTTPFKPSESQEALRSFLSLKSIDIDAATPTELFEGMLAFYAQAKAAGLNPEDLDSDMLLYEWGVYDWGEGERFQIGITRQFIEAEEADDDAISQLSLTIYFAPSDEALKLKAGNLWCDGTAYATDFHRLILDSEAFRLASSVEPERVEIYWSYV